MPNLDLSFYSLFDPVADNFNDLLPLIPNAIATLLIGILVIRVLSWTARWLIGYIHMPKGLQGIIISILDALLAVFLVIVVLQSLELNNLALIFTAGVAAIGIALGNGSAMLVSDIVSGIHLARDRDFMVGDMVKVGSPQIEGEIVGMDMRRTRVLDGKGYIHSFPNSVVERQEFVLITKKKDRKS